MVHSLNTSGKNKLLKKSLNLQNLAFFWKTISRVIVWQKNIYWVSFKNLAKKDSFKGMRQKNCCLVEIWQKNGYPVRICQKILSEDATSCTNLSEVARFLQKNNQFSTSVIKTPRPYVVPAWNATCLFEHQKFTPGLYEKFFWLFQFLQWIEKQTKIQHDVIVMRH